MEDQVRDDPSLEIVAYMHKYDWSVEMWATAVRGNAQVMLSKYSSSKIGAARLKNSNR